MKSKTLYIVLASIVVVIMAAALILTTQEQPSTQKNSKGAQDIITAPRNVMIRGFSFEPADLRIKAGTAVIWTNQDTVPHTVESGSFVSGELDRGASFQQIFATPGEYEYHCSIHPSMKGKITVE